MWWNRALFIAGKNPQALCLRAFNDNLLQELTYDSPRNIDIEAGCFALTIGGEEGVIFIQGPNTVVGATNALKYKMVDQVAVTSLASAA